MVEMEGPADDLPMSSSLVLRADSHFECAIAPAKNNGSCGAYVRADGWSSLVVARGDWEAKADSDNPSRVEQLINQYPSPATARSTGHHGLQHQGYGPALVFCPPATNLTTVAVPGDTAVLETKEELSMSTNSEALAQDGIR
jgi:hypothetical protein